MGLYVTAYSHMEFVGPRTGREQDYDLTEFANVDFPDRMDGFPSGVYRKTERTECTTLSAGPCSTYNLWRAKLAEFVGTTDRAVWDTKDAPETKAIPFYALIDMSDCEGSIGPVTSAALARQFDEHVGRAAVWASKQENISYWLAKYTDWWKVFRLAADGGFVKFN